MASKQNSASKAISNKFKRLINFNSAYGTTFNKSLWDTKESDIEIKTIKIDITEEIFQQLFDFLITNTTENISYGNLSDVLSVFNIPEDKIMYLIENIKSEKNFSVKNILIDNLQDPDNIEKAINNIVDSVLDDINNQGDLNWVFENLNNELGRFFRLRDSKKISRDESFERSIRVLEKVFEIVKLKNFEIDDGIRSIYFNFLDFILNDFKYSHDHSFKELPRDFIEKYNEYIPGPMLLEIYKDNNGDSEYLNTIEAFLKRNCENAIRRELGAGASLATIQIDWDMHSIILYDEICDDEDEDVNY